MRLVEFFNVVSLFEAAKDRYTQMFANLTPAFAEIGKEREFETEVNNEIKWAMGVLRKQDKVTWYLRFVKVGILGRMADAASSDADEEVRQAAYTMFLSTYTKSLEQLMKKMGIGDEHQMRMIVNNVLSRGFKRQMEHFMSLELPALEGYVFTNQTPDQILSDWTPVERAWQQKVSSYIENDPEDGRVIKEYSDGSQWADLERPYCTEYGDAMGHCGNAGDPHEPNTSIVYRTSEETEKGPMWKPRLFFVYNKDTGMLGETKGRENQKPDKKYHSVIMDLLRDPLIKGIKGGGYKPENNFKLEDLPADDMEALVEEKPGLASMRYDYKKRGMTKELLARIEDIWTDTGEKWGEYKHKSFIFPTGMDIDGFVKEYGGDQGEWVIKNMNGDIDTYYGYDGMPYEDVWDDLPPKVQAQVGKWLIENHPDEVEEWKEYNDQDYDGTDSKDTWAIIEEGDFEGVKQSLRYGMETGNQYGAEAEMYADIKSWIEDLPNDKDLSVGLHPGIEKGWDSQQSFQIPEETMIDLVSDYADDLQDQGDLGNFFEFKGLEAPYHGWQGYDEEAAVESAIEHLGEEGILP